MASYACSTYRRLADATELTKLKTIMLDHIILAVSDLPRSVEFYERALAPLGISHYIDYDGENGHPDLKGFGCDGRAFFWLKSGEPSAAAVHFAFIAESRDAVQAFYEAAMAAGAHDNVSPRVRSEYHERYYAADILDPDGYSVEVVIKD
jgi:catechol 2,3-dioxygenase-like lactoylglutathione lyase family enzyme